MALICPECMDTRIKCVTCGEFYKAGLHAHCLKASCQSMNSPLDCLCGYIATEDLKGLKNYTGKIIAFIKK